MADLPVLPGVVLTPGYQDPHNYADVTQQLQDLYTQLSNQFNYENPYMPPGGQYDNGGSDTDVGAGEFALDTEKQADDRAKADEEYSGGSDTDVGAGEYAYPTADPDFGSDTDVERIAPPVAEDYFVGPLIAPGAAIARVLLGGLGVLILNEIQNALPRSPEQSPPRPPPPPPDFQFFTPELPNWEDIANEPYIPFPDALELPQIAVDAFRVGGLLTGLEYFLRPGQLSDDYLFGQQLPISDLPGLFANPLGPLEVPEPQPLRQPKPQPIARPAPRPYAPSIEIDPSSDPFVRFNPDPLGNPFAEPRVTPGPRTVADPFNPTQPIIGDPLLPGGGGGQLLPRPSAPPAPTFNPLDDPNLVEFPYALPEPRKVSDCNCVTTKEKKKKKKKKKPRTVCYRGTYREYASGLSKSRLEEIPCASTKTKSRKPGKPTVPGLPSLARELFFQP